MHIFYDNGNKFQLLTKYILAAYKIKMQQDFSGNQILFVIEFYLNPKCNAIKLFTVKSSNSFK